MIYAIGIATLFLMVGIFWLQVKILTFVVRIHNEGQFVSLMAKDKAEVKKELEDIKALLPKAVIGVILIIAFSVGFLTYISDESTPYLESAFHE